MLSSIFKKTQESRENKRAFESLQRTLNVGSYASQEPDNENQEEDGFLVVGETEKERKTIKPLASPPSYDERQEYALCSQTSLTMSAEQPSFQPGHGSMQSDHTPGAFQSGHTLDLYANDPLSRGSALNGVPFQLSPTASLIFGGSSTLGDLSVPLLKAFEPKKFDYDFTNEHSVVKEEV